MTVFCLFIYFNFNLIIFNYINLFLIDLIYVYMALYTNRYTSVVQSLF